MKNTNNTASMSTSSMNNLITAAKAGDANAINDLWNLNAELVEKTHEHGKLGTWKPKELRSKYAKPFNKISGKLYMVFLKCIEDFDANRGMKFSSYLSYKVQMFALDEIRAKSKKITRKGETMEISFVSYEALQGCIDNSQDCITEDEENLSVDTNNSSLNLDKTEAEAEVCSMPTQADIISEDDAELNETAKQLTSGRRYLQGTYKMGYRDPAKEKVNEIINLYTEGTRQREVLETYLKMSDLTGEDPTVREMGEEIGVTGALVSHYMKNIRKDVNKNGISYR